MPELFTVTNLVALLTLTILEIVLGVDNIIFLAIVTGDLPPEKRPFARQLGLGLALVGRIGMVLGITWLLGLDVVLFSALGHHFSIKDLILLAGGLFLTYKAVTEIYKTTELREEGDEVEAPKKHNSLSMAGTIAQIMVVDMVFAIDSVLTAVGLTQQYVIIIIAMTIAIIVMMVWAGKLSDFIHDHPSLKVLALAFLVLVGVLLISEGFGQEIERNYVYFAILFSLGVEALNFRRQANALRKKAEAKAAA
ncbi:MAG: TerC family protein [Coriobacteriia bacterium]|nr:TerC family protein [Coriobacteriia bacterium]